MTVSIDNSYKRQFSDNVYQLLEQKTSLLRPTVEVEASSGDLHCVDRNGVFEAAQIVTRMQPTVFVDPDHSRRCAIVQRYGLVTYLDDADKFKLAVDPTSSYAKGIARSHARALDDEIIRAMLGNAATGKQGTGSQPFDSNQQIAHGSAGLSITKINTALEKLEASEVDMDYTDIYLAVGANGVNDLLEDNTNRMTSIDFQNTKALSGRQLPEFRGIKMVRTQRVTPHTIDPSPANNVYRAILYTQNAVRVAMQQEIQTHIELNPSFHHVLQISVYSQFGAVRTAENELVDILFK